MQHNRHCLSSAITTRINPAHFVLVFDLCQHQKSLLYLLSFFVNCHEMSDGRKGPKTLSIFLLLLLIIFQLSSSLFFWPSGNSLGAKTRSRQCSRDLVIVHHSRLLIKYFHSLYIFHQRPPLSLYIRPQIYFISSFYISSIALRMLIHPLSYHLQPYPSKSISIFFPYFPYVVVLIYVHLHLSPAFRISYLSAL